MGSKAFQFLSPFPIPISQKPFHELSNNRDHNNVIDRRCFSGGRSGGSKWDWDANVNLNQRSRLREDYVDEEDFGFRKADKKRVWWFDDFLEENDEEEDDNKGFGVLEASIGFNWVSKVFQAFGWMIPAVITSLVLGTGGDDSIHGSIFMALALPLGQTVVSLITEKLWKDTSRPKTKRKKRSFPRNATNTRPSRQKETNSHREKRSRDYKSWVVSSNDLSETGKRSSRDFGGWDELDNHIKLNTTRKD